MRTLEQLKADVVAAHNAKEREEVHFQRVRSDYDRVLLEEALVSMPSFEIQTQEWSRGMSPDMSYENEDEIVEVAVPLYTLVSKAKRPTPREEPWVTIEVLSHYAEPTYRAGVSDDRHDHKYVGVGLGPTPIDALRKLRKNAEGDCRRTAEDALISRELYDAVSREVLSVERQGVSDEA